MKYFYNNLKITTVMIRSEIHKVYLIFNKDKLVTAEVNIALKFTASHSSILSMELTFSISLTGLKYLQPKTFQATKQLNRNLNVLILIRNFKDSWNLISEYRQITCAQNSIWMKLPKLKLGMKYTKSWNGLKSVRKLQNVEILSLFQTNSFMIHKTLFN